MNMENAAFGEMNKIIAINAGTRAGCISCFGCKREKTYGKCVCRDGLSEVLDTSLENPLY